MRDDKRELDDLLARAVAAPPLHPERRARLRRRVLELHPEAGRRHDMTVAATSSRRARAGTRRRNRWLGAIAAGGAIAALLGVVLAIRSGPAPGPGAEFGRLPSLASGSEPSQGAAGGPGFTFDLGYSLSTALAARWPVLPGRETVYRLVSPGFTEDQVRSLAAGLGLAAPVVREGWQDGFILAVDQGTGGPALRAFSNGYIICTRAYDYRPRARASLPTAERAIAVARDWLAASGFVPADQLGAGKVTEDLENGTLLVNFRPAEPADVVSVVPFAVVQVGEDETVAMGSATWFPTLATSPYPLRPVAEAWEKVKAGDGVLAWSTREYPGPAGDDNVVRGPATVESVRVAWAITFAADGTPYLEPVYAFSGRATVPSPAGPVSLPVEVWAPAVTAEYVEE